MAVSVDKYKDALSTFASGVTVVTSHFENSNYGMTVSSFTSVSLDPALVLVCLKQGSSTNDIVCKSKVFGVNILSSGQETISNRFANSQIQQNERFDSVDFKLSGSNVPLIGGCLANLECRLFEVKQAGDHDIFIGEVEVVSIFVDSAGMQPLLYQNRQYGHGILR